MVLNGHLYGHLCMFVSCQQYSGFYIFDLIDVIKEKKIGSNLTVFPSILLQYLPRLLTNPLTSNVKLMGLVPVLSVLIAAFASSWA